MEKEPFRPYPDIPSIDDIQKMDELLMKQVGQKFADIFDEVVRKQEEKGKNMAVVVGAKENKKQENSDSDGKKMVDNKSKKSAIPYVETRSIEWTSGPFPSFESALEIFRKHGSNDMVHACKKMIIGDNGYGPTAANPKDSVDSNEDYVDSDDGWIIINHS